ncbi:hypothetical protein [Bacillus litorisediminis]|uniref:hypothetical protein n=1 Tax=Bacillus litorisediminis TaxID=2922713 RepID=UPI0036F41D56
MDHYQVSELMPIAPDEREFGVFGGRCGGRCFNCFRCFSCFFFCFSCFNCFNCFRCFRCHRCWG